MFGVWGFGFWDCACFLDAASVHSHLAVFLKPISWERRRRPALSCLELSLCNWDLSCSHALQPIVDVKFGFVTEMSAGESESGDQCFVLGENITAGLWGFCTLFRCDLCCS